MKLQESWFSDKQVMNTIRNYGLAVSLLLATVCLLVQYKVIDVSTAYAWAGWPLAIDFVALGLLQRFWDPLTKGKLEFYLNIYLILGIINSVLLTGFNTLIFFGWLLLIILMDVFFGRRRALVGYGLMLLGVLAWVLLPEQDLLPEEIITLTASALSIGAVAAVISVILEFTLSSINKIQESKNNEELERGRLTSLINSMADGVIAVDTKAKVLLYNAAALEVLDINSSMQQKSIGKFMPLLDKTMKPVDVVKLVRENKVSSISRDYRLKYSDSSVANLYLAITPVHLGFGKGGNQGFVLILRDITREKSLEEERDEFISVVSHELRTPIAISEGNISNAQFIAEHNPKPEMLKKALDEAHNQVLFLADMINDLATLSRSERGKLTLELEDIAIPAFANELIDNYTTDAKKKGLELKLDMHAGDFSLRNSKLYVREILQNFITNAIKYTEEGSVTLAAEADVDGVKFAVRDTGIGISKSDQDRVFDKFFRSEDYRTRQHNGTGLGLYVTMKLVQMVRAEVSLDSELNKGSTFTIRIPNIQDATTGKTALPAPEA